MLYSKKPIISKIIKNFSGSLIGQDDLVKNLLIALISGGHILIEGLPGLAKTLSASILAKSTSSLFKRIQFTSDLLPSDLIGTEVFYQEKSAFEFVPGPIFANLILADEINRSPAKVQSALLEAMAERQVTVGRKTYKLPEIFLVIATENPIEEEGVYPLPEAELDRFMLHVKVSYPNPSEELKILELSEKPQIDLKSVVSQSEIIQMRKDAEKVYMDQKLKRYIVDLVQATRNAEKLNPTLAGLIKYGASPRATIFLAKAAKALAYIEACDFVTPNHIQTIAPNILRHRLGISYKAEAEGVSQDSLIHYLLELVNL